MEMKFYRCKHCGQMIAKVKDTKVPVVCCGEAMEELKANTTDAAIEKHVPTYIVNGNKVEVTIGSTPHPMEEKHHIEWIALQTKFGNQRKCLKPGDQPTACFRICDNDEVVAVYTYCNLHSLWKK